MSKVKVLKVVQVDNRRFSTVRPAVDAIAWNMAMVMWDRHRMKYLTSGENYEALDRMKETAIRRITPIIQQVFA